MYSIKQPSRILFGKYSVREYQFSQQCLVITSKGTKSRGSLEYSGLQNEYLFEDVEPNPSIETAEKIISEFRSTNFSHVVGLGGGSSMDVAKYVGYKMNKKKIMIPTTFGSGSEVTRISVLKINGNKKSFHDDNIFADISIIDSFFIENTPKEVLKNSVVDALAQCSEAYDSKNSNIYTKFLCNHAFNLLESGILNHDNEKIVLGSLYDGLGFGNSSTTLGHALSYVYSNEGISHGHALAFTTAVAHKFNKSKFYERFINIVSKLGFSDINLNQDLDIAADKILLDKKHLENNPIKISKKEIISLLKTINGKNALKSKI
ncbi:iron-containing alcohol dehydrogenase [Nitrosopumilus adriaticus]|uniref:iron-containing alcohol dehydrogenase n=1 Tax=Nitrosopumilus adriaticus TaxID=1580092 RepID=UPI00352D907A